VAKICEEFRAYLLAFSNNFQNFGPKYRRQSRILDFLNHLNNFYMFLSHILASGMLLLEVKLSSADSPALRPDGPRSGQFGAEAGRSAVRTVRGGGADGPRARRVS
jgi:hypothetical protein